MYKTAEALAFCFVNLPTILKVRLQQLWVVSELLKDGKNDPLRTFKLNENCSLTKLRMKGIEQISNNKFKVLYGHTIIGDKVGFIYRTMDLQQMKEYAENCRKELKR